MQPANTWSSFAYVLVGSWLGSRSADATQRWLGVCAIVIGLGSALYHASLTFAGQFFDVFGMYLLTAFMLVRALARLRNWPARAGAGAYIALMGALSLALWFLPDTRRWLFALVLVAALLAESARRRALNVPIDTRWFWMGLLTFALGYAIWILDNARVLCDPASWLQGHALWHVLGAASTMFLANYYRIVEQSNS